MVLTNEAEAAEHHMSNQTRGLYRKFKVERTDSKSAPSEKHHGCEYFVLDMDHDKHARAAIEGYVQSLEKSGEFPLLAVDLRQKYLANGAFGLHADDFDLIAKNNDAG